MLKINSVLKRILTHPLAKKNKVRALERFFRWQLGVRILRRPVIVEFVDGTSLIVEKGVTAGTGNIYKGIDEFKSMSFAIHCTRRNDVFIDIGSNIGTYAVLASGVSGAKSIAIEPSKHFYKKLRKNILINDLDERVECMNLAVSSESGVLKISEGEGAENRVIDEGNNTGEKVESRRLDEIFDNKLNGDTSVIKIDVEGFEKEVIEGGEYVLSRDKTGIIIEIGGLSKKYNTSPKKVHEKILEKGFTPIEYHPFERRLEKIDGISSGKNTIYVKNIDLFKERARSSDEFQVLDISI